VQAGIARLEIKIFCESSISFALAIFQQEKKVAKATQTPPQFDDSVKECSTLMVMIIST